MRTTILLAALCLLWTGNAFGQDVGDRIVTTNHALLKIRKETVGSVPKGKSLTINGVNGDWFWVIYPSERGTTKGWINRRDVIEVESRASIMWHGHGKSH
jgi:hypothetical protein